MNSIIEQYATTANEISILPTLISFFACIIMSFILRSVYIKRSFSLNGKTQIGNILPILCLIVFLVIVIVKSSLALSLGLVGALSIVRFRTPIKEPEDLIYLFIAIGIGLGYGSGQVMITTILILIILLVVYIWLSKNKVENILSYNLIITWSDTNLNFEELQLIISEYCENFKLVRLEKNKLNNTAVTLMSLKAKYNINDLTSALLKHNRNIEVVFFEADNSL